MRQELWIGSGESKARQVIGVCAIPGISVESNLATLGPSWASLLCQLQLGTSTSLDSRLSYLSRVWRSRHAPSREENE
jgi:hypothetical protein